MVLSCNSFSLGFDEGLSSKLQKTLKGTANIPFYSCQKRASFRRPPNTHRPPHPLTVGACTLYTKHKSQLDAARCNPHAFVDSGTPIAMLTASYTRNREIKRIRHNTHTDRIIRLSRDRAYAPQIASHRNESITSKDIRPRYNTIRRPGPRLTILHIRWTSL